MKITTGIAKTLLGSMVAVAGLSVVVAAPAGASGSPAAHPCAPCRVKIIDNGDGAAVYTPSMVTGYVTTLKKCLRSSRKRTLSIVTHTSTDQEVENSGTTFADAPGQALHFGDTAPGTSTFTLASNPNAQLTVVIVNRSH
jgi:hypothetical protein